MATKASIEPTPTMPETFNIMVNGEEREIFMSFGLLNDLTTIVSDPGAIAALSLNHDMRNQVLASTLAKRKKSGKVIEPVDIDDIEVKIEDVEKLLDWIGEHVMSFFVRSLQKLKAVNQKHEATLTDLVSSLSGQKDSASAKP